jgi:hypothetical protein
MKKATMKNNPVVFPCVIMSEQHMQQSTKKQRAKREVERAVGV